jgi:formate hydrogenlyase subunit 3/multisubunit Na+/H+ antiporter MnhD subunit
VVLTLLAILIAALVASAAVAAFVPRSVVAYGSAGAAAVVVLLALVALADASEMGSLALPLGPAGSAMHLVLDPLGASFLLLVFLAAGPRALFAEHIPGSPLAHAALALILLAADACTLAAGLLLLAFGTRSSLRAATFGVVCLVAALALMAPASAAWPDCDFAAIRAVPPEGWRASAVLFLVLLGVGSSVARADSVASVASCYVLIRLLLDLSGPAQPLWWGVPLLIIGITAATAGSLRANFATTLHAVLSIGSLHQLGFALVGIGLAMIARSVDLPDVTLLALQAIWLLLACHVLCQTLLLLCAGAMESGAGTRRLDRLGGLIHRMPATAMCTLAGLSSIAALPPGLGFAGFWLLVQALLAAARIGGFGLQLLIAIVAALAALSVGLVGVAAVRLFGVACLGRPRTPRTAVAEDAQGPLRIALVGLASLTGLLAVLPALALLPAASALAQLANGGADRIAFAVTLRPSAEAPGYPAAAIAGLLLVVGAVLFWLMRRDRSQGHRQEAAWSGGFAPPPAWLPFGDPATQYGPASFAEPLRRALAPLLATIIKLGDGARLRLVRLGHRSLRAVQALAAVSVPRSVATALALLVLAASAWLVAP